MLKKEEGYDEFLAECIRRGREEADQGLGYTLEESKARARQVLERKARENAEFEKNNGAVLDN